tara:strand:+ start:186 stop:335 length:150 start_codon:yes stop_codon:yes gene_type:complete
MQSKYYAAKKELQDLLELEKHLDKQVQLNKQKIKALQRKINRLSQNLSD